MKIVTRIINIVADFDLSDPLTNLACLKKLLKKLRMPGRWIEKDDVRTTRELILEVEARAS